MENRQKIIEKLVKIKALAERGIGGEQQTAQVMYATLKFQLHSQQRRTGRSVENV